MYLETLLFLFSIGLMFLGTVALVMPNLAREYFQKHYRLKKPERWLDYLYYVKRPIPLWMMQAFGIFLMIVAMFLLIILAKRLAWIR